MSKVQALRPRPAPRKPQFPLSDSPAHWLPDDPFASHIMNAMSLYLPPGELMFCRAFQQALPYIEDERLREAVQAFIRQEAMHARQHDAAAEKLLAQQGIHAEEVTAWVEWLVRDGPLAEKPFGKPVPDSLHKAWIRFGAGVISSIEHATCYLGNFALDNSSWEEAGGAEAVIALLKWHGAEEIEHRCVAFDVYEELGGGYGLRLGQFVFGLPLILGLTLAGASKILSQDEAIPARESKPWRPAFWRAWARSAKRGHLPSVAWMIREQLRYLKPDYNPVQEGDTAKALAWLNQPESERYGLTA